MEKNYTIFNVSEINNINFAEVLETSAETLRKSVDGNKTFVKWIGEMPISVQSLKTKEGIYSYLKMLEILNGENWYQTIEFKS
jgi:hypothetical protein